MHPKCCKFLHQNQSKQLVYSQCIYKFKRINKYKYQMTNQGNINAKAMRRWVRAAASAATISHTTLILVLCNLHRFENTRNTIFTKYSRVILVQYDKELLWSISYISNFFTLPHFWPGNFPLKSAKICDKICLMTKQRKFTIVWRIANCVYNYVYN